jgi:hypothetical protein
MNGPRYTIDELRHVLMEHRESIAETVVGQLTGDAVLEAAMFQLKDVLNPDGSVRLDTPAVRALIGEWLNTAVTETIKYAIEGLEG